ncbi:hypothetical protein DEO72_LG10g2164 [Vigna unguiculata]|uniref:Transposase n=1 Tax=Vigna unguiculata TaxID=3917 RepID=A0A4D6NDH8_VIGUN|nr:hypothetical protein DEO72_LG10g2164 [Vigna unguiculata]
MSSSSDRFLLSDSGSERSRNSGSSRDDSSDREEVGSVGRIPVERVVEIREDPSEELAESNWPTKTRYEWGARRDIIAPERVTAVECACHGREGAAEEFFYMYMCHFSQLHIRLPFDEFTMGVLRLLNVAPTQLHPNSWAYLPKSPITWLLLISQPGLNKLEAFTQSFKHFKDGFFKVVVKPVGRSHFYTTDGNTKFSFFWTGNPWRYKVISREDLSVGEKEVVDTLMQFSDKMPTKGLVRLYNSVHPIIDIEGHMAQLGKKNLTFFQALRKEKVVKAKAVGNNVVPNLQDSLVDVHMHGGSASGVKGPEARLIELPKTTVRKDIEINVPESLINSIDNMEPRALVKAMVEFSSKTLLLSRRVGSLYERELKEGNRTKVEELQEKVDKHDEEKEAWKKEKEEWELERKRLATWRVRCLDSKEKLKGRIAELETDYDDIKE